MTHLTQYSLYQIKVLVDLDLTFYGDLNLNFIMLMLLLGFLNSELISEEELPYMLMVYLNQLELMIYGGLVTGIPLLY